MTILIGVQRVIGETHPMHYITSVERIYSKKARQEGLQEGMQIGIEKGMEKGIEKGMEKGIEKGIEKGVEKGIKKGRKATLEELALKLIKTNLLKDNQIRDLTGLSLKAIAVLRIKLMAH